MPEKSIVCFHRDSISVEANDRFFGLTKGGTATKPVDKVDEFKMNLSSKAAETAALEAQIKPAED